MGQDLGGIQRRNFSDNGILWMLRLLWRRGREGGGRAFNSSSPTSNSTEGGEGGGKELN